MSIRTEDIAASAQITLDGEVYPVVTLSDLQEAMVRLAVVIDLTGGCGYVETKRIPTGTPNEYVTTRAMIVWADRTNAKPQPEQNAISEAEVLTPEPETAAAPSENGEAPLDDGMVVDPLAVDESDVPEALRS